jgi:tryptophan synthase
MPSSLAALAADTPQMGTTGSSANTNMSAGLPELIARIRSFTPVPLAVGFGVANRTHFEAVVASGADGVVIGSKIINVVKSATPGQAPSAIQAYCHEISHVDPNAPKAERRTFSLPDATSQAAPELAEQLDTSLPSRFGTFGGAYVAESLYECLTELEAAHKQAMADPEFWKELESHYPYMNRPSHLYLAENLTEYAGGAKIWLK